MDEKLVALLLFTLLIYGCTRGQPQGTQSEQCKKRGMINCWGSDDYGFSLIYPDGWQIEESGGAKVAFTSPQEAGFSSKCSILREEQPVPVYETFSEYLDKIGASVRELYKNNSITIVSFENRTLNGMPGREFVVTYNKGGQDYKVQQIGFIGNEHLYTITCSSRPATYDEYKPIFESIITSFKFG
ncbi:MAG: hypothetical protein Sv326_0320 [Candidatus Fermentimicrarchaeum limneticum]|uniref:PsbP C-terminal domain-containing protein n=1 Tax=Fermentimicrarchaeum limneticum TaxID=2795018 RepID=A0A7D6BGG9_FERL1|nr:MAG: hypothetical protein Sv326_0320 [Candidatus Fermentimicrarchaeum limneticum]